MFQAHRSLKIFAVCLPFLTAQAFAGTTTDGGTSTGTTAIVTPSTGGGGNASGQSSGAQTGAIITGVGSGAIAVYEGTQCGSANQSACLMAGMAALQAISSLAQAGSAGGTAGDYAGTVPNYQLPGGPGSVVPPGGPSTDCATPPCTTTTGGGTPPGTSTAPGAGLATTALNNAQATIASLANAGYTVDTKKGTVTAPNGQSMSSNSSPDDLMNAGMSGDDLAAANAVGAKAAADALAKLKSAGAGDVSFGSMGKATAMKKSDDGSMGKPFDPFSMMNKRAPSSVGNKGVAGLSKKLGDENIGVKGDNIFEMINRRYQSQDRQNMFIKDAGPVPGAPSQALHH